jgi:hypothetical protein
MLHPADGEDSRTNWLADPPKSGSANVVFDASIGKVDHSLEATASLSLLRRRRVAQAEAPAIPKAIAQLSGSIAPPPPPDLELSTVLSDSTNRVGVLRVSESDTTGAGALVVGKFRSDGRLFTTLRSNAGVDGWFGDWMAG